MYIGHKLWELFGLSRCSCYHLNRHHCWNCNGLCIGKCGSCLLYRYCYPCSWVGNCGILGCGLCCFCLGKPIVLEHFRAYLACVLVLYSFLMVCLVSMWILLVRVVLGFFGNGEWFGLLEYSLLGAKGFIMAWCPFKYLPFSFLGKGMV